MAGQDPLPVVVGILLVLLGATGATLMQKRFEREQRSHRAPMWLIPFGVLIGAGAALVRGWDVVNSMIAGAVLVPLVAAATRLWEVRRARGQE